MTTSIDTWDFIHLLGAFQGFFLAFIFFFLNKGNRMANRFLALLLFVFSMRLLDVVAFWTRGLLEFPHFSLIAFPFSYLIGVALFFYTAFLIGKKKYLERHFWVHLLPFVITALYMMPYYLLSGAEKVEIMTSWFYPEQADESAIAGFDILLIMLQFPHALIYTAMTLRLLKKETKASGNIQILWLKRLTVVFAIFFSCWLLYNMSYLFGVTYQKLVDLTLTSAATLFIYSIGYYAFRHPEIHMIKPQSNGKKYESSTLTDDQAEVYLQQLEDLMKSSAPYKNSQLKLSDLAAYLNISAHHLSQIINDKLNQSYFEFINSYRVKAAKKLLADPENYRFTLSSIAYDVGFNNKTSFNSFFKKTTGVTPSQFRSEQLASL